MHVYDFMGSAQPALPKPTSHFCLAKIIMEQHCGKYKGMFKDQCFRITPKVLSGIEPGTVRAPRKILDAAIVETKTCKYVADCGSLFVRHSPPMSKHQRQSQTQSATLIGL